LLLYAAQSWLFFARAALRDACYAATSLWLIMLESPAASAEGLSDMFPWRHPEQQARLAPPQASFRRPVWY
jgi:hypothetical protein